MELGLFVGFWKFGRQNAWNFFYFMFWTERIKDAGGNAYVWHSFLLDRFLLDRYIDILN